MSSHTASSPRDFAPVCAPVGAPPCANGTLQHLQRHQFLSLHRPRGLWLRAERGSLWVTVDGETDDIELTAGQSQRFDTNATVTVGTFGGDAVLCTVPPPPPAWQQALRRWVSGSVRLVHA